MRAEICRGETATRFNAPGGEYCTSIGAGPTCHIPEHAPEFERVHTMQMVYTSMEQRAAAEAEDDDSGERAALEAEEMALLKVPYHCVCPGR